MTRKNPEKSGIRKYGGSAIPIVNTDPMPWVGVKRERSDILAHFLKSAIQWVFP